LTDEQGPVRSASNANKAHTRAAERLDNAARWALCLPASLRTLIPAQPPR